MSVDVDVNVNPSYAIVMKKTDHQKWGIKTFAEMFGVTPRTIRFYEDKGLLTPKREGGVRVFDAGDHLRFEKIMRGKRLGFSLEDIGAVFDVTDGVVSDRAEIQRRKDNFQAVVDGLAERRRDLDILHGDMTEVIAIANEALGAHTDADIAGVDEVSDLAERYQAAFDVLAQDHSIDFLPGSTPNPNLKTPYAST